MRTSCGSPCYAAPELVVSEGQYCGRKVDVWSCGVILYAMLAGYLPFDDDPANPEGDNINLLYKYIVSTPLTFPEYVSPLPRDLLRHILVPDPNKRASLRDVVAHNWLQPHARLILQQVPTGQTAAAKLESQEMLRSASERTNQRAVNLPADNHLVSAGFSKNDRIDSVMASVRAPHAGAITQEKQETSAEYCKNTAVSSQVATLAIPAGPGLARSASHTGSAQTPKQPGSVPDDLPPQLVKTAMTKLPVPRGKPRPTSYHPQRMVDTDLVIANQKEQVPATSQVRVGSSGSANSRHSQASWSRNSLHLAKPTGSSPKSYKTNAPGEIYSSPQKPAKATLPGSASVTADSPEKSHRRSVSSISSMTAVFGKLWPPDSRSARRASATLADIGETERSADASPDLEAQTSSRIPRSTTLSMLSNRLSIAGYFEPIKPIRSVLGESSASNIQASAAQDRSSDTRPTGHARNGSSAKKFFNLFGSKKRHTRESSMSQV